MPHTNTDSSGLSRYGWTDALDRAFTEHYEAGLVPARISRVDRGLCTAITASGPARATFAAPHPPGSLLTPCTGDWAALRPGAEPHVVALLPRHSAIVRSSASRSSHGQVLAANVDTVVIALSLATPLDAAKLERLLALAWESGAQPVIVLTKADLVDAPEPVRAEAEALAPGVDVLITSVATGQNVDVLAARLRGTSVLLGPSGAGKSSLGNVLLGEEVLATGTVRAQDGKGRHTTVRRELLPLPGGGVLIDTPGLRGISLHDAADGLEQVFAEIEDLAAHCRFGDCGHDTEPGCAVQAAIAAGELPERRLRSYRKLQRENAWAASRTDARLRDERVQQKKAITSHLRATYRFRDRQP
ncbi:Probable GTPase related to EngC [[Actinomadura] parvosata subsp. kistnae]|uniref:Small ribosomal subunit biogenesis GTPase RsgA n=1 Tax=[Actinomadura] parvosata subsp. kistnae TaxID=1909395 RepID=A0A1U9ZZX5_9ACTN|nr:ribosome small subunit-dependent GTPase A [Nonomuraea sp. ATCC 55076]AQZ63504.1 ribosome small subunit-dependent GTPase A [Nonomuraea sp. ATCC 55076]SPL99249.1 Probable GTPase related to EngC [Actinomadura parvosata subsp. kistnae]